MNPILSQLDIINELLIENARQKSKAGLLNGKLGLSIYFFTLARETKSQGYQEILEKLIGEVYDAVDEPTFTADFEDGLTGIASGICYLTKNKFVSADLDEVLGEVDDRIYRHLMGNVGELTMNIKHGLLGYLLYYVYRLECAAGAGDQTNEFLFRRICATLINRVGVLVEEGLYQNQEPVLFTIYWDFPILLMLLSRARRLNINPNKVDRILEYLTPTLTSLYPRLHSNRLYLLLGVAYILRERPGAEWREHAGFLKNGIDVSKIIDDECKNLDIMFHDGVSGLAFIGRRLAALTGDEDLLLPEDRVIAKVRESVCWGDGEFYQEMKNDIGLSAGLSGVGMLLLEFLKQKRVAEETGAI